MNGRQVADAVLSHGHLEPGMHVMVKPFAMEALAARVKDLLSRGAG